MEGPLSVYYIGLIYAHEWNLLFAVEGFYQQINELKKKKTSL